MIAVDAPPCTRQTERCAKARDYNFEIRLCCWGHIVGLMRIIVPILDDAKVRWWADYGTLLGAVRNPLTTWADYPWLSQDGRTTKGPAPGIVPHDKDADLGVLWTDWPKVRKLVSALGKAGCVATCNYRRGSMKVRVSAKNHTNVDLFFWKERGNGVMYRSVYAQVDRFKGKVFSKTLLLPFSTVEWEGMKLPAPRDPKAFLAMRYGPNWRVAIPANNDGIKRP